MAGWTALPCPAAFPRKALQLKALGFFGHLVDGILEHSRPHRHLFLQQLPECPHGAVPHKALLHHAAVEGVVNGHQAHAQMVGHKGADHLNAPLPPLAGRGEIQGLIKTVFPLGPHVPQQAQIAPRPPWRRQQRQKGGIGRDHQFTVQPPLEAQALDSVGLILVTEAGVEGVKAGLRGPPGGLGPGSPARLLQQAEGQGFIHQTIGLYGQEQLGHEILKHGPRPGGHPPIIPVPHQHPAQTPPVPGGDFPAGHGDIAGLPGLAGHQVIPPLGVLPPRNIVADIEEPPLPVVELGEPHPVGEGLRPPG